jgi:hypothetical protein
MKIFEGELSQVQIDAGLGVMKGQFEGSKVMRALKDAGVKNNVSGAEVLIQRELRLGHIRRITRGIYERCDG